MPPPAAWKRRATASNAPLITLRRAALDAIDSGDLACLTLRVCGDRRRHAGGEGAA
ncbi:protein of unknown function [Methylorubrum extorquens]|uniref:Uncharacterized protein n=1 Tax=Methylorubrum extorquens TaxID=408 RepID=A0A2N9AVA2_METEX|nr:protein of unknown function [Methylorubrum extorquens]